MASLQELVANALSSGPLTASTGQDILTQAIAMGASAQDLSALANMAGFDIPESEVEQFINHYQLSGGLPAVGSAQDVFEVPVQPTIPQVTSQGDVFTGKFNNNPGALGFSDLNPAWAGANTVTTLNQTAIPEFLKPFLADSANHAQGALNSLASLLVRENALTSPLNNLQDQAQQMALNVANGEGGFIPQAQSALMEIADSSDIVEMFNDGRGLMREAEGQDALRHFTNTSGLNPTSMGQLSSFASNSGLNQTAQDALTSTASGDYLFGSPAFNEAVQASIRSSLPHINSQFALQGGAGGLSGGLADTAIAQVASDAFAREYSNERNRQLGAANQLNNFGLSDTGQQITASGLLGNLGLSGRNLQQGAASTLSGLSQNAGLALIDSANQDRNRQLAAISQLPQIGLLPSQITGQIGDFRQAEEERQKLGQIQAMQGLLGASFGNINPTALLGRGTSESVNDNTAASFLGGLGTLGGIFDTFGLADNIGGWIEGWF